LKTCQVWDSEVQFKNIEKVFEFVVLLRKLVCTDLSGFQNLSGLLFEIRGVKNLTGLKDLSGLY